MFTTTTTALKAALVALTTGTKGREAIIRSKGTIPHTPCALLSASPAGAPMVSGCDLDMTVQTELPGTASRNFRVAVDARALKAAVGKFKCDALALEDIGGHVTLRSSDGTGATVKLCTVDAADFPEVRYATETAAKFTLPAAQLFADLERTAVAMSTEETRYYLFGTFFHVHRETEGGPLSLRLASTDGHRLVRIVRDCPEGAEAMPDIIVPAKVCAFLTRALKRSPGTVSLRVSASKLEVMGGGWRVVAKLIDGTFPDYARVIPSYNEHSVAGDAKALVADIDMLTAHQGNKHRNFTLSAGDSWATGWAACAENGNAGAVLSSISGTSTGQTTFASFNAKYLSGVVGLVSGKVRLLLNDASCPVRVEAIDQPEFTAVIMPLRYADRAQEPADIARLNMSAVERFEDEAPRLISAKLASMQEKLGKLATAAIDSITVGDRRTARVAILARLEEMREERGRATLEAEGQPQGEHAGSFRAWSRAQKGLATRYAANRRDRLAKVSERVTPADTGSNEALERRIRRLTLVLAGRKAQLATVGQALAQSQARTAALRKGAAMAGASALAAAGRETIALGDAA